MVTQLIPSFNAGELSPLIHLRSDLAQYRAGCRTLENMLITPYGGVRRRPGMEWLGGAKGPDRPRLIPFRYSTSIRYMLELGEEYLRVWDSEGELITTVGEIVPALPPGDDPRLFRRDFYRNESSTLYRCVEDHEETTFAADLAAGKWILWPTGILEFYTPYQADELREVQFCQINAEMRFAHPLYEPQKFRYEPGGAAYFREIEWEYPALLEENTIPEITIETDFTLNGAAVAWAASTLYLAGDRVTYSGKTWKAARRHTSVLAKPPTTGTYQAIVEDAQGLPQLVTKPLWTEAFADYSSTPGQEITLESTADIFTSDHVGAYYEISKQREVDSYEVSLKALDANDGTNSDVLVIQGGWQFDTFGTWDGTFYLERSKDRGATWEDVRSWESDSDRNVSSQGEEPERCLMRLRWEKDGSKTTGRQRGVLSAVDGFIKGIVRITAFTSETEVTAECITPVELCVTQYWSEGAWSDFQGFPRTVAAHEQRVLWAGTAKRSQTVWGSAVDDYENFQRGVEDDDSYAHSLAADQQNEIQWMLSQKQLLIGTAGGEWVMASSKDETPITPTNVRARRHSSHGSEYLAATLVNEATLFVQRGARKLREMVFSFEADGYVTQDLTMLAEHITDGGIVETAYQQQRDAILWAVTGDGKLIGMTYERGQKVAGWARHVTDGDIGSVAVLTTPGEEDEVWVAVNRTTSETEHWQIERFKPDQFRAQVAAELDELFFVDSGVRAEAVSEAFPITGVTGISHLNGMEVEVIADGSVLARRTVSGGAINLDHTGDPEDALVIVTGLPYTSTIEPMAMEIGMQNGTSVGRDKRVHEVAIYFHQSAACEFGATLTGNFDVMTFRKVGDPLGTPPELYTGLETRKLGDKHDPEASLVIRQRNPMPLSVLAIIPKWNIFGDDE